jgi:hypothetical protein
MSEEKKAAGKAEKTKKKTVEGAEKPTTRGVKRKAEKENGLEERSVAEFGFLLLYVRP